MRHDAGETVAPRVSGYGRQASGFRQPFLGGPGSDGQVCQLLEAAAPGQPPCEPLVDYTDLVAGRPWPKQLHDFMARCHAAIVLLTRSAIASPWVLKEATILAWRLSINPQFRLFVAQAPDVTPPEMEQNKFGPLMLGEVQRLPQINPPAIALEIRQRLGQATPPPTPFDRFVRRLAASLARVSDETLNELAQELTC